MDANCILYERQPDGTYKVTGELPKGTRFCTVVSSAQHTPGTVQRVKKWLEILDSGPLKQDWYKVVPAENPHPMSDKAKEKLRALNESKKEVVHVED